MSQIDTPQTGSALTKQRVLRGAVNRVWWHDSERFEVELGTQPRETVNGHLRQGG